MKLYRYMSRYEFVKMSSGAEMKALINRNFPKAHTNSEGFCFLGEEVKGKSVVNEVLYEMERKLNLKMGYPEDEGIEFESEEVSFSPMDFIYYWNPSGRMLVEFEVGEGIELKEGWGQYAYYKIYDVVITEYSTLEYNKKNLVPKRFIMRKGWTKFEDEWEEYDENKNYTFDELKKEYEEDRDDGIYDIDDHINELVEQLLTAEEDFILLDSVESVEKENILNQKEKVEDKKTL